MGSTTVVAFTFSTIRRFDDPTKKGQSNRKRLYRESLARLNAKSTGNEEAETDA